LRQRLSVLEPYPTSMPIPCWRDVACVVAGLCAQNSARLAEALF